MKIKMSANACAWNRTISFTGGEGAGANTSSYRETYKRAALDRRR